ncbi:TonB family protein [Acinetobacter pittii]|uniref:energy transducer TonB n=2 Tax=Acinetobacter TaxID=469 RepID=UPI003AA93336
MKVPEPPILKKDPILVHFVNLQSPPKLEPVKPPTAETKPEPVVKPQQKPEPIKPIEKVEKIQAVKKADAPKQVMVNDLTPIIEQPKKAMPIETPPVVAVTETKSSVETLPIQTQVPLIKNVEIGGNGVQWRREPRISIDESELRGSSRVVLLMIEANEKGEITSVKVLESSGISSLDAKVIRAVRNAKLKPYTENGVAYAVKAKQPFQFN